MPAAIASPRVSVQALALLARGEHHGQCGALVLRGLHRNRAAVALDDARDGCQLVKPPQTG